MMRNFIFDLMPVLLFFIIFQYQGIYAATWGGIIATTIQVLVYRWYYRHWEKNADHCFNNFCDFWWHDAIFS